MKINEILKLYFLRITWFGAWDGMTQNEQIEFFKRPLKPKYHWCIGAENRKKIDEMYRQLKDGRVYSSFEIQQWAEVIFGTTPPYEVLEEKAEIVLILLSFNLN